ncbi:MAG: CheR family methyltransferase [Syntrophorhabdales bacterium]|jgi:chemotaxis methyl-accepting protein methylase
MPSDTYPGSDLRHVYFEGKRTFRNGGNRKPGNHDPSVQPAAPVSDPSPKLPGIAWILEKGGLDASAYRSEPLARRLPACLRAIKARSMDHAREILENRPELLPAAISSLLIGVTEFFRDPSVFEALRTRVLPRLARPSPPLRILSAACSTGAELYSVAILLAEAGLLNRAFLLGTDCRTDAIEKSRSGLYKSSTLATIGAAIRDKYFESSGDCWNPVEALRLKVHWKVADINHEVEDGPWDIVLWRNTAIYLNPSEAEKVWRQLVITLAPGGFLVTGKAERLPVGLNLVPMGRCIYRNGPTDG